MPEFSSFVQWLAWLILLTATARSFSRKAIKVKFKRPVNHD